MIKKWQEVVISGTLIVTGIIVLILSRNILVIHSSNYTVDSAFFPRICASMLILLGLLMLISELLRKEKRELERETAVVNDRQGIAWGSLLRMGIIILALCLYVVLLNSIGFIVMSAALQIVLMLTLAPKGKRGWRNIFFYVLLSAVLSFATYLLFSKGLKLILPNGILKGVL